MKSRSQAGQDLFVQAVLRGNTNGRFIDIGASHPIDWSNTYELEQLGWKGVMVDVDLSAINLCRERRANPAICCDAATCDWPILLSTHLPDAKSPSGWQIDYASVDIDEWTHQALLNLLQHVAPRVLTVEHDQYQRGDRLRIPNRKALLDRGYYIIAADVHSNECCFEDWFVHPGRVNMADALRFESDAMDWKAILKQGGAL